MDVYLGGRRRFCGLRTEALRRRNTAAGMPSTFLRKPLSGRTRKRLHLCFKTSFRTGISFVAAPAPSLQRPTPPTPPRKIISNATIAPRPPPTSHIWLQPPTAACRQDRIACRRRRRPETSPDRGTPRRKGHRTPTRMEQRLGPSACSKRSTCTQLSRARRSERGPPLHRLRAEGFLLSPLRRRLLAWPIDVLAAVVRRSECEVGR